MHPADVTPECKTEQNKSVVIKAYLLTVNVYSHQNVVT